MKLYYYYSFIIYKPQFSSFCLKSLFSACWVAFRVWLYLSLSKEREKEKGRREEIIKGVVGEMNFWNLCSLRARNDVSMVEKIEKNHQE